MEKADKKINFRYTIAAVVVGFSVLLVIASFIAPPLAILDNSILAALGEFLAFAGSCLGFHTSYEKKKIELEREYREKQSE